MNFITPEQVAELLKVDVDTILLWLKHKKLPGVKIGNIWRIEEGRLQAFLSTALDEQYNCANKYENYTESFETPAKGKRGRKPTGKYEGLKQFLKLAKGDQIKMSFADIEAHMKEKLPQSAYNLRPWWANDFSHSQARAWLHAGWETRGLNLLKRYVTFVRRS
jgi:excisionase family DNA binding protein